MYVKVSGYDLHNYLHSKVVDFFNLYFLEGQLSVQLLFD